MPAKHPAVFLDRDGTIIHEKNYLRRVEDLRLFADAPAALKLMREAGFRLIVVTNQSGIARGYLSEKTLQEIHDRFEEMLGAHGVGVDGIYYCPHGPEDACDCRKPNLGLVLRAAEEFDIDLERSFAVGDRWRDVQLGRRMGGRGVFVLTGHGQKEMRKTLAEGREIAADFVARNLSAAARWIVKQRTAERQQ